MKTKLPVSIAGRLAPALASIRTELKRTTLPGDLPLVHSLSCDA
jgi:hypothetical protein